MILKYLLEPYFEENTIDVYGIHYEISRYLQECCQLILSCVDAIKSISKHPQRKKGEEIIREQLQIDLEWQAKTLAFKLISKKTDFWYIFNIVRPMYASAGPKPVEAVTWKSKQWEALSAADFEDNTSRYASLARDKKFMKFSKNLGKEYEQALTHLIESGQKWITEHTTT